MLTNFQFELSSSIQSEFLQEHIEQKSVVVVHLINGKRFRGRILAFDAFSLVVDSQSIKVIPISSIGSIVPTIQYITF